MDISRLRAGVRMVGLAAMRLPRKHSFQTKKGQIVNIKEMIRPIIRELLEEELFKVLMPGYVDTVNPETGISTEPKRRGRKPIFTDEQRRAKAAAYQRKYRARKKNQKE